MNHNYFKFLIIKLIFLIFIYIIILKRYLYLLKIVNKNENIYKKTKLFI